MMLLIEALMISEACVIVMTVSYAFCIWVLCRRLESEHKTFRLQAERAAKARYVLEQGVYR